MIANRPGDRKEFGHHHTSNLFKFFQLFKKHLFKDFKSENNMITL